MRKIHAIIILVVLSVNSSVLIAQLKLPAIIGDNMVLQRDMKVPVWGWASPNEKITVSFKNKTYAIVTADNGKWLLHLEPSTAGGPYQMIIKGRDNAITINNILIGDVWLASGQSNMEFGIQSDSHSAEAIAAATDSLIHFFYVPMSSSLQPMDDIAAVPAGSFNGKWVVCSPELMANKNWAWHGFSAAGYYFARGLRSSTKVPIGMIGSYKGGTPAQAWMSVDGLKEDTTFSRYVATHQRLLDNYEQAKNEYPQKQAAYQAALKQWNAETGKSFDSTMAVWEKAVANAKATNQPEPPRPQPAKPRPQNPASPDGGFGAPGNLYNAMIAPLIPYAIKGVIWYQGESNGDRLTDAHEYDILFPGMITDWRRHWKEGDFPFLFVQLTSFRAAAKTPSEGNWPWVREAQLHTLSLPHTGMAVSTDIGDADDIHPKNKLDVGLRLALAARHVAYNEKITYSGPLFKSMTVSGNKIRITFLNTGKGLIARPGDGTALNGFGIAGPDKKFVWAKAVIEGDAVVVYSDEVQQPVAVRYNWADNPPGNLFNKEGLPASPFRTDNWMY